MNGTAASSNDVAKGMVHWEASDCDNLSNYTRLQTEWILPYIGRRVLEVGAGGGRLTSTLHAQVKFDRYVAVEPSPVLLKQFQSRCPGVEVNQTRIEDLPAQYSSEFDTILLVHVLEHIEEDLEFLRRLCRFLKPGGRIIILVPALNWLMSDLDRNIGHFRRYDNGMMRRLSDELGLPLEVLRYENLIGIPGWLWFCKIRKVHYQESGSKRKLFWAFNIFDKYILPWIAKIEKWIPPPIGLHLTAILKDPRPSSL